MIFHADIYYACEQPFFTLLEMVLSLEDASVKDHLEDHLESIFEIAWERLHSVHYSAVPQEWRVMYTLACCTKAYYQLRYDKPREAIRSWDMALLMAGAPVLRAEILAAITETLQTLAASNRDHDDTDDERSDQGDFVLLDALQREGVELKDTVEFPGFRSGVRREQWRTSLQHPIPEYTSETLTIAALQKLMEPAVLRAGAENWPACSGPQPWPVVSNLFRIDRLALDRHVPIEVGSSYTEQEWSQKIVSVREFLQAIVQGGDGVNQDHGSGNKEDQHVDTNDRQPTEGQSKTTTQRKTRTVYLAQHALLDQVPSLWKDILTPDYCFMMKEKAAEKVRANFWLGPAHTKSPLHTDPQRNWFTQVVGYKYVRLYSPTETAALYPFDEKTMLHNTSQVVDLDHVDLIQFPRFQKASYVEAIVGPGDMLYVRKWRGGGVCSLTSF